MKPSDIAKHIPQVEKLLNHPKLQKMQRQMRRECLTVIVRLELDKLRQQILNGGPAVKTEDLVELIVARANGLLIPQLKKVLNGTGVILNTNLGRAPLPDAALARAVEVASGYCNLEIDLVSGKRGERGQRVSELLEILTGCEAALVVNNNAAAVSLVVNTLAKDREVVVSRGELVEIGGSFRLPEVVLAAGAHLKEIGTTNRTRLADYLNATSDKTGIYLKCHRSNFQVVGFTEEVAAKDLAHLAQERGIPVVEDLGSGLLLPFIQADLACEPSVADALKSPCDLVTFSGDKLLGGPQAGIVVGQKKLIDKLRANPLYRAFRADKLVLAVLEQILIDYLTPRAQEVVPVLQMVHRSNEELKRRAGEFATLAQSKLSRIAVEVVSMASTTGGGSLPGQTLPSYGLKLTCALAPDKLARILRRCATPVIAVVQSDHVCLNMRTISPREEEALLQCLIFAEAQI